MVVLHMYIYIGMRQKNKATHTLELVSHRTDPVLASIFYYDYMLEARTGSL